MHKNFELSAETIKTYMDMAKKNEQLEKMFEDRKVNVEELRLKCEQNEKLISDLNMELEEGQRYNDLTEKKVTRSESTLKKIADDQEGLFDYVNGLKTKSTQLQADLTRIRDLYVHVKKSGEILQQQKQDELKNKEIQELEEKTQCAKHCDEKIAENNLKIENMKKLLKLKDDQIDEKRNSYLELQNQVEMRKNEIQDLKYRNITKLTEEIEEQDKINTDLMKKINTTSDTNEELERKNLDSVNRQQQMTTVIMGNKTKQEENIQKIKELREILRNSQLEKSKSHDNKMPKSRTFVIPQKRPSSLPGSSIISFSEQVPEPSTAARIKPFNIRLVESLDANPAIPQEKKVQSTSKLHSKKKTKSPRNNTKNLVSQIVQLSPGSSETSSEFSTNFVQSLSRHTPFTSEDTHPRPIMEYCPMKVKIQSKIKGKETTQQTIHPAKQSSKSSEASSAFTADSLVILSRHTPFLSKNSRSIMADSSVTGKNQEMKGKEMAQQTMSGIKAHSAKITEIPKNKTEKLVRQIVQQSPASEASSAFTVDPSTILSRHTPFTSKNTRPIMADTSMTSKDQEIKGKKAAQPAISEEKNYPGIMLEIPTNQSAILGREKVILSPGSSDTFTFSLPRVPQRDPESSQHKQLNLLTYLNLRSNGQKKN